MQTDQQEVLERVAVHASRFAHLVIGGQAITLCGRLASGRRAGLSTRPRCRRCENVAFDRGHTVTP